MERSTIKQNDAQGICIQELTNYEAVLNEGKDSYVPWNSRRGSETSQKKSTSNHHWPLLVLHDMTQ